MAGHTLRGRITLAVVAVVVLVMAAVAVITLTSLQEDLKASIAENQGTLLALVADDLDRKISEAHRLLVANAATLTRAALADLGAAQEFLDARTSLLQVFDNHIGLFDAAGVEITESPPVPQRRGRDYSYRPYIQSTLATGKPQISDPYRSSQSHGHPAIMMTAPVRDEAGELVAILAGSIDLMQDNLLGRLAAVRIGRQGRLSLTTAGRVVIMHPDKQRILERIAPGADALYDRAIDQGFEGTDRVVDGSGVELLASYKRLRATDWLLISHYPVDEAYAPLGRMRVAFALSTAAGLAALVILLAAIIRHVTSPLTELTRHVTELPRRRGPERLFAAVGDDEIGTLSRAFNTMVAEFDAQQRELGESQELFSLFMTFTPVYTFIKRVAGGESRVLHVSANYGQMLGIPAGEMAGRTMGELFPPELAVPMTADDLRVVREGEVIEIDESFEGRDYRTVKFPIRRAGGDLLAGFTLDVTDRKRAEERLRESEMRFRELADALPQTVYETDLRGIFSYINRTGLDCFGYAREEVVGSMTVVDLLVPEDRERGQGNMEARFRGLHTQQEYTAMRKDGTRFPVIVQAAPILKGGEAAGLRGILIDITDRKRFEAELLGKQKLESLGVLAGGIAHDFNNVLTVILGNLSLIRSALAPGDALHERIAETEQASLHARDLTQQLLTFARGGVPIKRVLALEPLVQSSAAFAARGTNVSVELRFSEGILPVEADEVQLAQVFNNLVINACQAMPEGGTISIVAATCTVPEGGPVPLAAGDYVCVRVSDHGGGIPAAHHAKIFDPYFTTKQKGSGLGLAVAYSVMRSHGGHIEAASSPGGGATFTLYLPASRVPISSPERSPAVVTGGRGRVLVMDDNAQVRSVVAAMLGRLGYEAVLASDGDEAVSTYRRSLGEGSRFDAVILDLTVPGGMGGKEAVGKLREIDPDVRAVVSSGYSDDPVMADFLSHGFAAVVRKPFQLSALDGVLRSVVRGSG